jgi:hypothetical protein
MSSNRIRLVRRRIDNDDDDATGKTHRIGRRDDGGASANKKLKQEPEVNSLLVLFTR